MDVSKKQLPQFGIKFFEVQLGVFQVLLLYLRYKSKYCNSRANQNVWNRKRLTG